MKLVLKDPLDRGGCDGIPLLLLDLVGVGLGLHFFHYFFHVVDFLMNRRGER
jgi:hypothetical protein